MKCRPTQLPRSECDRKPPCGDIGADSALHHWRAKPLCRTSQAETRSRGRTRIFKLAEPTAPSGARRGDRGLKQRAKTSESHAGHEGSQVPYPAERCTQRWHSPGGTHQEQISAVAQRPAGSSCAGVGPEFRVAVVTQLVRRPQLVRARGLSCTAVSHNLSRLALRRRSAFRKRSAQEA
ncbi:hypothetical protein B0T26DRAFT_437966 [Lasiosphaeria miniovina]|uniref:Uncharacterized protein n=1 Tax=Lasiosphaeria miniovina TaxID=1954250 RepID=A0AA39ZYF3_9PEZI|nr:uncharacterized protein B0T26DRAFT_437966 [Lasiosphaeria miniovina]KAK0705900.1 hypothetical protein B0T26DRAFT_437966 [Lasiosphaeria miniovina]